jgi:D-serine dehydratase
MGMSRQIEVYRKVAADYDRMALFINDQRLRNMFLGFAQQWREAAMEADAGDQLDQLKH